MIVYKSAGNNIITLELPSNSKNNVERSCVFDKNHAKFRCSRALVVSINDKDTGDFLIQVQSDYNNFFIYRQGEFVTVDNYDESINTICARGIHFYLSYDSAYYHNKEIKPGLNKEWDDNGTPIREYNIKENQYHGCVKMWHSNGFLRKNSFYANDKRHGLFEWFTKNGVKWKEASYKNGKLHGYYKVWHKNGKLKHITNYKNGKCNGGNQSWYKNGQVSEAYVCENGVINGVFTTWYHNGQRRKKCNYVNGRRNGWFKYWLKNGKLCVKKYYIGIYKSF